MKSGILRNMMKTFIKPLIHAIMRHNIGYLAAVMAYFAFTSMIPLVLLLIYGASLFINGTKVEHFFDHLLQSYIPAMPKGKDVIGTTINRLSRVGPAISIIGFGGLLWGSVGGFISLQKTLDTICEIRHRRAFWKQYVVGFGMLTALLVLIIASLAVTTVSPEFASAFGFAQSSLWIPIAHASSRALFAVALFVTCYFAYRFLPSYPMSRLSLLCGAAVATICIYGSRELFMLYTHHLGNYQLVYGALTYVMLVSLWIYIASVIFLFGMEITLVIYKQLQHRPKPLSRRGP